MRHPSRFALFTFTGMLGSILVSSGQRGLAQSPSGDAPVLEAAFQERQAAVPPPGRYEIRLPSRSFTPPQMHVDWNRMFAAPGDSRVHVIVQLSDVPDEQTRAALAEAGILLGQPLTGRAYLASVRRGVQITSLALRKIRWAGTLAADDKISPELRDPKRAPWARRVVGKTDVVVKLFSDGDFDTAVRRAADFGGNVLGQARAASVLTVSLRTGRERELAALDDVRWIEPMPPPGEGESDRARTHVHADVAGTIPAGRPNGNGVTAGVFDGGHASTTHPDFGTRVTQGDTGPYQPNEHATMTAGMIAGDGSQSQNHGGTANQWRGFAPAAQVRSYSYLNSGTDHVTDYLNDVTDAVQNDAVDVLNNSWGDSGCTTFPYGSYAGRAPFLDGVVTGSLGRPVTIVFSAGNERYGYSCTSTGCTTTGCITTCNTNCITNKTAPFVNYTTLNHPKSAKNVILVGAIDSANNAMTDYSSWGPTLDGRIKPEIVASGQHNGTMTGGVSHISYPFGTPTGNPNQQGYRIPVYDGPGSTPYVYGWFDETSSAAAIVSGGITLMIDDWRRTFPGRADPLPSTLRALLVHNAQDLDDATSWYNPGPDYASGYGLVQINETLQSLERGDALEGSVAHQTDAHYFLDVPAGTAQVRVTLAWDDPPALENANPTLINDLDLVVTDPAGTRQYPWTLDPTNPSANAVRTKEDHVNNLEQVLVDNPVAGTWSVIVRGTNVTQGRQAFSLVTANNLSRRPVDLILALDTSDSMNSAASSDPGALPKIELLRRSVKLFLETWNLHAVAGDRVGMATFSSNVATTPAAVPALEPFLANFTTVSNSASALTASGCTALGGALQVAFNSFDTASTNKRAILLLSDGMQSANPFVGESGTPSLLQIGDFSLGASMPFGAFFCTQNTATGPGGSTIVPDGSTVTSHGAEIHTIGVGVNGTGFHDLIQRLATEDRGLYHFTTTPDSNLDLLYINDLVRALKSNTLEVITTDSGTLAAEASKDILFPVNATIRSVTAVVSWQDSNGVGAVDVRIGPAGGTALVPDEVRQGDFFTLLKFNLPGAHGAAPGNWRATLRRVGAQAVGYQVSIIADDNCFHYDFASTSPLGTGDPLRLTAQISSAGRALQSPVDIRAKVSAPVNSFGGLLAEFVPTTKAGQEYLASTRAEHFSKAPAVAKTLQAAWAELSANPEFLKAMRQRENIELALKPPKQMELRADGTSLFSVALPAILRPGIYDILWEVGGKTSCGPVRRQEMSSLWVRAARAERASTVVRILPGPRRTFQVTVKPADAHGGLLGPGMSSNVQIATKGFKPVGAVIDLLDGTYSRTFTGELKGPIEAQITVDGKSWKVLVSQKAGAAVREGGLGGTQSPKAEHFRQ